jgi:hypothetical protein
MYASKEQKHYNPTMELAQLIASARKNKGLATPINTLVEGIAYSLRKVSEAKARRCTDTQTRHLAYFNVLSKLTGKAGEKDCVTL